MPQFANRVTAVQMAELCRAVEAVPELWHIARAMCTEIDNLRAETASKPEEVEQLRHRDRYLSSLHTNAGRLDALNYVLYWIQTKGRDISDGVALLTELTRYITAGRERMQKGGKLSDGGDT